MTSLDLLERRVAALEQEVEGKKVVTRYILEQTRRNGDDLAALRARVDRIEGKIDAIGCDQASLRAQLESLKRELPLMIADSLREVLREERR